MHISIQNESEHPGFLVDIFRHKDLNIWMTKFILGSSNKVTAVLTNKQKLQVELIYLFQGLCLGNGYKRVEARAEKRWRQYEIENDLIITNF